VGSKAELTPGKPGVRFGPDNGLNAAIAASPFCANNRHGSCASSV
jgi:hypothetical protein